MDFVADLTVGAVVTHPDRELFVRAHVRKGGLELPPQRGENVAGVTRDVLERPAVLCVPGALQFDLALLEPNDVPEHAVDAPADVRARMGVEVLEILLGGDVAAQVAEKQVVPIARGLVRRLKAGKLDESLKEFA
jgi:hypothetical protein